MQQTEPMNKPANTVRSAQELYAHAIAMEREAAACYCELAGQMSKLGHRDVAAVFARLAAIEAKHLRTLERRTDGVAIPALPPEQLHWLEGGAPETPTREFLQRALTPQAALGVALAAEKRAQAFFEHVYRTAQDPALHGLAQEMAMEEKAHVALVERLLAEADRPAGARAARDL